MLRKLCDRGIFRNEDGLVSPVLSREEFYSLQSEKYVADSFHGSLPAFVAAFTQRKSLTREEIDQIHRLIDAHSEV